MSRGHELGDSVKPQEGRSRKTNPRIYTRGGDDGSTGLLYGGRVSKDDPRMEACGAIDEAVAALGVARALNPASEGLSSLLLTIQRHLFAAGAELAAPPESRARLQPGISRISDDMVRFLEAEIDRMVGLCPLPDYFVVPGENQAAAALDTARALIRRTERRAVTVAMKGFLGDDCLLRYLNRLSDLLFVAARLEEDSSGDSAPPSRPAGD